jgi:predicted dehydrogenase
MTEGKSSKKGAARRHFLKASTAAAVAAANFEIMRAAHAQGKEEIKVALIGCGGRGTGAAVNALEADPRVRIIALADVFEDRARSSRDSLLHFDVKKPKEGEPEKLNERVQVPDERLFVGFDAYTKALETDADYVILATPPHFRPQHLEAAINAGKHVFMEKPVAVDPVGCRSVMKSGELAKQKNLSIAAGTQRRHEKVYQECYQRILDGAIGEIVAARCYWNMGQLWYKDRESAWSPMEWMIRDWVNWCWLSGDHITEQHVHNLDVVNWFTSKDGGANHPVKAVGMGGRCHRVTGDQYDFFSVDFEYDNGVHLSSYCRQINGCDHNVTESVIGEKGSTFTQSNVCRIKGPNEVSFLGNKIKQTNPYVQEHIDLIKSIEDGGGLNEANNVATSTLTAIMGRIAAYTGRIVTWDEMMKSDLKIGPAEYSFDIPLPEVQIPVAGRA